MFLLCMRDTLPAIVANRFHLFSSFPLRDSHYVCKCHYLTIPIRCICASICKNKRRYAKFVSICKKSMGLQKKNPPGILQNPCFPGLLDLVLGSPGGTPSWIFPVIFPSDICLLYVCQVSDVFRVWKIFLIPFLMFF